MRNAATAAERRLKRVALLDKAIRQKYLLAMCLPFVVWAVMFCYLPLWGWLMAFQNYNPGKGVLGSEWVWFKHFTNFFTDRNFGILMRNTVAISFLDIVFGTAIPLFLALMLNEIQSMRFKRTVQTISYLPHFISYVVVANIFLTMLSSTDGIVNNMLMSIGMISKPIPFFSTPTLFWWLVTFINTWKGAGWGAIIYLAGIAGIDPEQYEAATVDGAGRWKRMWYITLPGIKPTIIVLLILSIPGLLDAGFDPSFLLGNPLVSDYSEVLDTYVYKMGITQGLFSYATAVGLLRTVVGLVLVVGANKFSRRVSDYGIY